MNKNYQEKEVKVLEVNVKDLCKKLEGLGAAKVFDGDRVFTTFEDKNKLLVKQNVILRLTEEDKLKLSISDIKNNVKETVKVFVSRKEETLKLFEKLGIFPIAQVKSHRISFEWNNIDLDIDIFPFIPSFCEIDLENVPNLAGLIKKLELTKNKLFYGGTEDIYDIYNLDYFEKFKIT